MTEKNGAKSEENMKKETSEEEVEKTPEPQEAEAGQPEEKTPFWKNKYLILAAINIILIIAAITFFALFPGEKAVVNDSVNMSRTVDLGVITVRGDGLPGYDINRDGKADYLSEGFGYYKNLYNTGGFEYGPGVIILEDFETEINMPTLKFQPDEIRESGVGSFVSFTAEDENSPLKAEIILKTLGPEITTYNLFIDDQTGKSYTIIDVLDTEKGAGTLEEREVEIPGKMRFIE